MNGKILIGMCSLFAVMMCISICFYVGESHNDNKIYINDTEKQKKNVDGKFLTMMYETEAGSGEYVVSNDTTWPQEGYIFNETLSGCENGSKLSWDSETNRVIVSTSVSDRCYVYLDKEPDTINLVNYIIENVYTGVDGENDLYYHDGVGSYTNADQEAGDYSYRYAGANPNNYVCFGSDTATCPTENLYRIIGVFNGQVKLINSNSIGNYVWDADNITFSSVISTNNQNSNYNVIQLNGILAVPEPGPSTIGSNDWSNADLNYYINNDYFFDTLLSEWQNKIATHIWQVGGATGANVYNSPVNTAYTYEVGASAANITWSGKIGLMYVSDYGYAASPANWSTNMDSLNNSTNRDNNWMFMGLYEWTISRNSDYSDIAFDVRSAGYVSYSGVVNGIAVRPSFYLESSVTYVSGDGSQENPFRIA